MPRTVTITLLDEARQTRCARGRCASAQPKKWTGPTLAAKGGGEVAMEELVLVHEGIEYQLTASAGRRSLRGASLGAPGVFVDAAQPPRER